jgi:two-component system sensor histidine kinase HydH
MQTEHGLAVSKALGSLSFLGVLDECLVAGLIAFENGGRIVTISPEAARMLNLDPGQSIGQPYHILPAPLASLLHDALAADKSLEQQELELRAGNGEPVVVRVRIIRLDANCGRPCLIAVLNDLSSARRLEYDITRLDRLANIGVLSVSMAHEVKNALVAVRTFIELTLAREPGADLADTAQREMKRIETILSRMLKFAGPSQPHLAPVRLHEILDHSLRLAQHQMTLKAIRLRRDYQAASDRVSGDEYQLEQAFVNIILNAVEAMGVGGTLSLETRLLAAEDLPGGLREVSPQPRLRVTVSDTGIGIPAEVLGRVFEPFFTTKPEGTGLGLAITRRILDQHHAALSVESEANRGSSFRVFFAPLLSP